jgi:hypothetical protein
MGKKMFSLLKQSSPFGSTFFSSFQLVSLEAKDSKFCKAGECEQGKVKLTFQQ